MVRAGLNVSSSSTAATHDAPTQPQPGTARPGSAWQAALLGLVLGVDAIGHCVALATLCFAGALVGGLGLATAAFLASTALVTLVLVRLSGFGNAIGIAQDTSIAILAPAAAYAATQAAGGTDASIATALAVIGAASVLSGLAFLAVGALGLGRIVRLVPYPVAAGFLASSGYLLALAALLILTESSSLGGAFAHLGRTEAWIGVLPAIALAAALTLAVKRGLGSPGVLAVILGAIAIFYVAITVTGTGGDGARALDLLPPVSPAEEERVGLPGLYALIDWTAVLAAAPVLAAVVLINLIGLLLNVSGVELAIRRDIDVDRELRVTGLANLVIGGFGGATGYMTSGSTAVAQRIGIESRVLGLSFVIVTGAGCFFAAAIVAAVPVFVAAGLLLFIGVSMLDDWLLAMRHRLMRLDWLIVLGIVALTAILGILPAIGIGLGLAVLAFAVGYARLPVVRQASDASRRRSTLDRPAAETAVLDAEGGRIRILHLQGYLFFGSVEKLIDTLQAELGQTRGAGGGGAALILDFGSVTGLDSAGCAAIGKLGYVARAHQVGVHLAAMPAEVLATIRRWGLEISPRSGLWLWPDLDAALEACENDLVLSALGSLPGVSVSGLLDSLGGPHPRSADLVARLEPIDLQSGDALIRHGTQSGDVFFLERGRLAVVIQGAKGQRIRVRSLAPGAVVGEVARYRDRRRTADVVAEVPSRVYRLSEASFEEIERDDRDLAALVHAILARSLSDKVVQTSRLVSHG
jgi:SulP family sulfate permease